MSRYIIFILMIFLSGCTLKQPSNNYNEALVDSLLVKAMFLESQKLYKLANQYYKNIYHITENPIILHKIINNYYLANKFDTALSFANQGIKQFPNDKKFYEQLATIYFAKKEYKKAINSIQKALEIFPEAKDYEFLGSLYLAQKRYQLALKYYKSAYALQPTEKNVNTIAYIMFFYLERQKEAIAYLETHSRIYGCQQSVCHTLVSFYSLQNNIEGLISVYKRLFKNYHEIEYAKKIAELYIYQKEYKKAERWAKITDNKQLLLSIYKLQKNYKKAYKIVLQLYKEKKDPKYLAQAAIFEFEGTKVKDKKLLQSVASKLEKAIKKKRDPIYLNYLGYLYIDYDINILRGIKLVKEALKKEPDSPYYLDSLAWGYYKLGKCKEALRLIKRVYYDLNFKDDEIQLHLQQISKCAKEKD